MLRLFSLFLFFFIAFMWMFDVMTTTRMTAIHKRITHGVLLCLYEWKRCSDALINGTLFCVSGLFPAETISNKIIIFCHTECWDVEMSISQEKKSPLFCSFVRSLCGCMSFVWMCSVHVAVGEINYNYNYIATTDTAVVPHHPLFFRLPTKQIAQKYTWHKTDNPNHSFDEVNNTHTHTKTALKKIFPFADNKQSTTEQQYTSSCGN